MDFSHSFVTKKKIKPLLLYCCCWRMCGFKRRCRPPKDRLAGNHRESHMAIHGRESRTYIWAGQGPTVLWHCGDVVLMGWNPSSEWISKFKAAELEWKALCCLRKKQNIEKMVVRGGDVKMCYLVPTFGFRWNKQECWGSYGMQTKWKTNKPRWHLTIS